MLFSDSLSSCFPMMTLSTTAAWLLKANLSSDSESKLINRFLIFVNCELQPKCLIWEKGELPSWHAALTGSSSCQHLLDWPPSFCTSSELVKLRGRIISAETSGVPRFLLFWCRGRKRKLDLWNVPSLKRGW